MSSKDFAYYVKDLPDEDQKALKLSSPNHWLDFTIAFILCLGQLGLHAAMQPAAGWLAWQPGWLAWLAGWLDSAGSSCSDAKKRPSVREVLDRTD